QRARSTVRDVADGHEEARAAARGRRARHHRKGRPGAHVHARAVRVRGNHDMATAPRPLRAGRREDERSTVSSTTGFTREEKAAMKARAKELKAAEDGGTAVKESLAAMSPKDRAIGKRIHELVKESAPDLIPKTWYGMPAYANKDGKVVVYFRNAGKFKERYS